jgi:cytochrome P450
MLAELPSDAFGLTAPSTLQDPYPVYDRLRSEAPVYFCEAWRTWVLTRDDDVKAAFRDPRWSADRAGALSATEAARHVDVTTLVRNLRGWALFMDPPRHTRVRALVNRAFTPRLMAELRPRIVAIVDELLDGLGRTVDLVGALAVPLPVLVIGDMLGLSRGDAPLLKRWSDELAACLGAGRPTPELLAAGARAIDEIETYFRAQLAERRRAPRADLLSALVASEEAGEILDEQELVSTCAMILFGGHETTTHLIGNGVNALLRHPDQWQLLATRPELIAPAVEELLRFDGPVQRMGRVAKEAMELRGCRIDAGQRAFLMLGAANRDPDTYATPDRLDVTRSAAKQHVAFGWGPHYCVGAALGRLEAEVAIGTLARRFSGTTLAETTPRYLEIQTIRGLQTLPVALAES